MTNIESAAKQDITATRRGLRAWMADHPFLWGAIAAAAGVFAVAFAALAW